MRLFTCDNCGQVVYFENVSCTHCGATLGFAPDPLQIIALEPVSKGLWRKLGRKKQKQRDHFKLCANGRDHEVCNWLVPEEDEQEFCKACRLNHTIPDLSVPGHLDLWHSLEMEKRRLVYSLLRLDLPVSPQSEDDNGLAFDFLADDPKFNETGRVLTGHASGLITLNISEADPAIREQMRSQMAEPYRTILGHFRHESGHYYWDQLVANSQWLEPVREQFGDETLDYQEALSQHYQQGPLENWQENFISAYAASHPWEDWAETWAHYLHMVDTLETAYQFGLKVRPRVTDSPDHTLEADFNPYQHKEFAPILEHWLPLTYTLNSLNRSMGHANAYPFVLTQKVIDKLALIHQIVRASRVRANA